MAHYAILKLRANFENREAIYFERGALRVRVSNIRGSLAKRAVRANVEELETPGLGVGSFDKHTRKERTPLRWRIGGGFLTAFSDHCWEMGYGGWFLCFDPMFVKAVLDLAARFPDDMDTHERYTQLVQSVQWPTFAAHQNWQKVFPET